MSETVLLAFAVALGLFVLYLLVRPTYDVRGKVVLITGGSRGLGLVLARTLADRGARLALAARDAEELDRAVAELRARGAEAEGFACDLADPDAPAALVESVRERMGPVGALVNNAGVIAAGPLEHQTDDDFRRMFEIHVMAPLRLTRAILPDMQAAGAGRIVHIASVGGKFAVPHLLPYVASKFALVGLSHGLRAELRRFGVKVVTVSPGLMRTGSHLNAEFKGRHEDEYAWFALGNAMPGVSMSAERAASRIAKALELGEVDVILSPAGQLGAWVAQTLPTVFAGTMDLVNRLVMPRPGGIGERAAPGHESRGKLPAFVTAGTDAAARRNNEGS